ncbi:hypothetical protein CYMTET_51476, partial [Cymbomonas tetramitiformis]
MQSKLLLLFSLLAKFRFGYSRCVHEEVQDQLPNSFTFVQYASHPYGHGFHKPTTEGEEDDIGEYSVSRKLAAEGENAFEGVYKSLRMQVEARYSSDVPPETQAWISDYLLPAAQHWWESALQVIRVDDALGFPQELLTDCFDIEPPVAASFADVDYVLLMGVFEIGRCAGNSGPGGDASGDDTSGVSGMLDRMLGSVISMLAAAALCMSSHASILSCLAASQSCQAASSLCKTSFDALAFGGTCGRDQFDRPVLGMINLCPSILPSPEEATAWGRWQQGHPRDVPEAARKIYYTVLHEMAHALGFTAGSIGLFRDRDAGGAPRTPRVGGAFTGPVDVVAAGTAYGISESTVKVSTERGHEHCDPETNPATCVYHLVTPAVRDAARRHFGCDDLAGAELENQPTSAGRLLGSHWEMRLFNGEVMNPAFFVTPFISEVTLAFFEDSGWYQVRDYTLADTADAVGASEPIAYWGWQQGCGFATEKCLEAVTELGKLPASQGTPPHFCNEDGQVGCTYDYKAVGKCAMSTMPLGVEGKPLYPEYAYFAGTETPLAAGAVSTADFCPFMVPQTPCSAENATGAAGGGRGESFGASSRCIISSLDSSASEPVGLAGGACYAAQCDPVERQCDPVERQVRVTPRSVTRAPGACYAAQCDPVERQVTIWVGSSDNLQQSVRCGRLDKDQPMEVPGYAGQLLCPDVDALCGTAGYCDAKLSELTEMTVITAIALTVALAVYAAHRLYMRCTGSTRLRWGKAQELSHRLVVAPLYALAALRCLPWH